MSGPVLVWEQLGLGFVRPLDEFAARASSSFGLGDFFGRLIAPFLSLRFQPVLIRLAFSVNLLLVEFICARRNLGCRQKPNT